MHISFEMLTPNARQMHVAILRTDQSRAETRISHQPMTLFFFSDLRLARIFTLTGLNALKNPDVFVKRDPWSAQRLPYCGGYVGFPSRTPLRIRLTLLLTDHLVRNTHYILIQQHFSSLTRSIRTCVILQILLS